METIILMVLLVVASSIFQAAVQKNKRQKDIIQNSTPVHVSRPQASITRIEPETFIEDLQTKVIDNIAIPEQNNEPESAEYPGLHQEITINDLQRSIIMSEVLGKPKALRRTSR